MPQRHTRQPRKTDANERALDKRHQLARRKHPASRADEDRGEYQRRVAKIEAQNGAGAAKNAERAEQRAPDHLNTVKQASGQPRSATPFERHVIRGGHRCTPPTSAANAQIGSSTDHNPTRNIRWPVRARLCPSRRCIPSRVGDSGALLP